MSRTLIAATVAIAGTIETIRFANPHVVVTLGKFNAPPTGGSGVARLANSRTGSRIPDPGPAKPP